MYSILNKRGTGNQNIVEFLAEEDEDLYRIKDRCDPGSTVKVLGEDANAIHTWIKSPSGVWALYEGDSDFEPPVNDAEIRVPNENEAAIDPKNASMKIGDFQKDIVVHPSGMVTGTLLKAEDPDYGENKEGHYFFVNLITPPNAQTYNIKLGKNGPSKDSNPVDGWLEIRLENIPETDNPKIATLTYDSGESFTFFFDDLVLEGGAVKKG